MDLCGNVPESYRYKAVDRRGIRSLVHLYYRNRIYDFPTDEESLYRIKSDIMNFIDYSYNRTEEKGCVEEEMVEEFHNIALVLRGYCGVKYGDLWESAFSDFHRELFRYVLEQGVKYNKGLIIKLLTQSEFILALCIYIFQYQEFEYEPDLILKYNDISVEDMNMLCFMTHRVCPNIKEKIKIEIRNLSAEELLKGISTDYFADRKKEINEHIRYLLQRLKQEGNDDRFDSIVRDILMLHIDDYIDIGHIEDQVKDHIVYRLLYFPESVDYESVKLSTFINIKSQRIVDNALKYGGYTLFRRVRKAYEKNHDIKYVDAFRQILKHETFRQIYYEEKKECGQEK